MYMCSVVLDFLTQRSIVLTHSYYAIQRPVALSMYIRHISELQLRVQPARLMPHYISYPVSSIPSWRDCILRIKVNDICNK